MLAHILEPLLRCRCLHFLADISDGPQSFTFSVGCCCYLKKISKNSQKNIKGILELRGFYEFRKRQFFFEYDYRTFIGTPDFAVQTSRCAGCNWLDLRLQTKSDSEDLIGTLGT